MSFTFVTEDEADSLYDEAELKRIAENKRKGIKPLEYTSSTGMF